MKSELGTAVLEAEGFDPLRKESSAFVQFDMQYENRQFPEEYWLELKAQTIKKFTVSGNVDINASDSNKQGQQKIQQSRSRLEMLENAQKARTVEYSYTNYQEFKQHIEVMTRDMQNAWNNQDRVKTLKLAIQASKMLKELRELHYFPSVFMTISDLLIKFGDLVYERLEDLAFGGRIPDNFSIEQVSQTTIDTAYNWFLKISCVRELQPRLYIEICLLRSWKFVQENPLEVIIQRLVEQIRGVGNPVMASYLGMFLARQTVSLGIDCKQQIKALFMDLCNVVTSTSDSYFQLSIPALEWICYIIAFKAEDEEFREMQERHYKHIERNSEILRIIIEQFDGEVIFRQLRSIMAIVERFQHPKQYLALHKVIAARLTTINELPDKYEWLNILWTPVSQTSPQYLVPYLQTAQLFIELMVKHFTQRDLSSIIQNVIEHLQQDTFDTECSDEVSNIMLKIISCSKDIDSLLGLDGFLPMLEQISITKKTEICKKIIEHFGKSRFSGGISNPMIIHALFAVTRIIHDSLDFTTHSPDFIQKVSALICQFIRNLNFGRDLEQHLNILTEARASFTNLEDVTITLIYSVLDVAMTAYKFVKGRHNMNTLNFLKTCISYVHITIPGLDSLAEQFKLFTLAAQVALINSLLGESESLVKAAIMLIPEMASELELEAAESQIYSLIGFMMMLPDNPASNQGYFIPAHGLFNSVMALNSKFLRIKYGVLICMLNYLITQGQDTLPLKIPRVDSNDTLFAGDQQFANDFKQLLSMVLEELLSFVQEVSGVKNLGNWQGKIVPALYLSIAKNFEHGPGTQVRTVLTRILNISKEKFPENPVVTYMDKLLNE